MNNPLDVVANLRAELIEKITKLVKPELIQLDTPVEYMSDWDIVGIFKSVDGSVKLEIDDDMNNTQDDDLENLSVDQLAKLLNVLDIQFNTVHHENVGVEVGDIAVTSSGKFSITGFHYHLNALFIKGYEIVGESVGTEPRAIIGRSINGIIKSKK